MLQPRQRFLTILVALGSLALLGSIPNDAPSMTPQPAASTMKAVRLQSFGPPANLKIEEVPRPTPGDQEILVRVHAAGVNPVDAKVRSGATRGWLDIKLPAVLGWDVAGTVEQVGKNVKGFKAGDPVYAYLDLRRGGGYAEFVIVKENEMASKPATLGFAEASAVPLAALTAWQALVDTAEIKKGQTVLIHGGSGGVGHFAVQIAKQRGCRVVATASAANLDFLRELGADEVIDYRARRFEELVKDVDVVLDSVGRETQDRSWPALKKGGILVSIVGQPDPAKAGAHQVRAAGILVRPDAAQLKEIGSLIDAGKISPVLSKTFLFAEAPKAHEQIETGHTRGKIVIEVVADK